MQPGPIRLVIVALAMSCSARPGSAPITLAARAEARPAMVSAPKPEPPAPAGVAEPEPASAPEPALPDGLEPGVFSALPVAGDADLHVAHGNATARRAIVYLHGACGDPEAPRAWTGVTVELGTIIALRGDKPCGKNERWYWGPDAVELERRVRAAIARVAEVRGDAFDAEDLVLMGYSQGATRAQELHSLHPERYPRVVLAGIPIAPSARHLAHAHAVAVLGGEAELVTHMRAGVWALETRAIPVRFDRFPKAAHGEYGPDAERVMRETFAWLLAQP